MRIGITTYLKRSLFGNMNKALEDYSKAISLDSNNPIFFENRALVYTSKGNEKKALSEYQKALELTTDERLRDAILDRVSALSKKGAEDQSQSPVGGIDLLVEPKQPSQEQPQN